MCDAHLKDWDVHVHLHSPHNMMRTHNYMHHIITLNEWKPNESRFLSSKSSTQWELVRNFIAFTEKRNETNECRRVIGVLEKWSRVLDGKKIGCLFK